MTLKKARRFLNQNRLVRHARSRLGISAPVLRRPIFLVGTVRSGTTYFARCLEDHPQVINAGFELSREWYDLAGVDIATPGLPCAHCPPAGPEAVAGRLDEVREGFAQLHLTKGGSSGTRLFNKSPHLWNKLPLVKALFPDAVLLVTSRDLRSIVASTKRLWEKVDADWGVKHYLPEDPAACWSCVPPAPGDNLDPSRLFPGGRADWIAEYWLRVYETIEREAAAFADVVAVRHEAFVTDPVGMLRTVEEAAGLRPEEYPGLAELQKDRNQRWRTILDERELADTEAFIEAHRGRIERLRLTETLL